jgi:hypothetical protein
MDIVTGNPTIIKMVIHYTRGERGQNVLRELIGPVVKEVLERKDLILLTSPVDVYRGWINQMETQTGEASYVEIIFMCDIIIKKQKISIIFWPSLPSYNL